MEINIEIFNKLVSFIDNAIKNETYELEARFFKINEDTFTKIFQKLTFSKDNNGFGYKYTMKNILDVILDKKSVEEGYESIRLSVLGKDDIKKYCILNNTENLNTVFIEKENIDKIDEKNYNLRFSLKNELPKNNIIQKNIDLILSTNSEKLYRVKNRYSIITDDNLFQIDMTCVKSGIGKTLAESNALKERISYEVEIEFIGRKQAINNKKNIDNESIANKLLYHCYNILKVINNSDIILTNSLITQIKNNYKKLANLKSDDDFIAASPVTLHREHLFKTEEKNIFGNYAVTLKADGERNFLYVDKTSHKLYLFNGGFQFIDTGYYDDEWTDTLIEGEYIDNIKSFFMYDILFSKGVDVRKRYLMDIKKDTKFETRLTILDNFLRSQTRKLSSNFTEETALLLYNKRYIQTVRSDGSDIFEKTKELWDTRKLSKFNVDGIIFTPKYEHYPSKGVSWYSLFKWKPPELNTIDFLIRSLKDDNGNEIKSPHIDIITRDDGKKETVLKQYKTFQLFVSGEKKTLKKYEHGKNDYNNKNSYSTRRVPVLFNPFNMDEQNSKTYNLANLIINDDEKIYAIDPLTFDKEEIYSDIIAELGYDLNASEGFKWVPIRFRRLKTEQYKLGKNFGNSEKIAIDIFRAINEPVSEEMITTGNIPVQEIINQKDAKQYYQRSNDKKRFPYQNFHNLYIKYQLLYLTSPNYIHDYKSGVYGKILDLCCGRGVDINKIKDAKYAEIVGIDKDYKNIKEAQEWYKTMIPSPKPKAFYTRGDTSKLIFPNQDAGESEYEKENLRKCIPTKYIFDTVSLQFCFHYFYENEITLRTAIQNITDNLKIGGFVIGTTFDGMRVHEQFSNGDSIEGKLFDGTVMWKIDKKYPTKKISFTEKTPHFGKVIDVFIKTIGVVHPEYLVNFNYLDKIMSEYGFSKVFIKPFSEFHQELMEHKNLMNLNDKKLETFVQFAENMSEEEKRLSFLYSGFIYKKEKNASDTSFKKLIQLMEKDAKLKKKDIPEDVYIVDEDTDELIINSK